MVADTCRSCGAPIFWCRHHATGRPAPIDATPIPTGNVILMPGGKYAIVSIQDEGNDAARFTNHYATCPQASAWRRGERR